jgi:hypothetical protein
MRGCWSLAAPLLLLAACDAVFRLDRVEPPADAPPDASPDAPPDASTVLTCATGPIILLPTDDYSRVWTDQVPAGGTHADKVGDSVPDDDASYIASMSDGQFDLYTHLPIANDVTIESVSFYVRARLATGTTPAPEVGTAWRVNGTPGWDDVTIGSTWADYTAALYNRKPGTTEPWTVADVNEMKLGVRKAYNTQRVLVTRVWAIVECR